MAVSGLLLAPLAAGAASPENSLSGSAEKANGLSYSGTVTSNVKGQDVQGTFTIKTLAGTLTVDATCLQVANEPGGRVAGVGGKVLKSTDPDQAVGSAIGVHAFDANGQKKDGLSLLALTTVPKPNDCEPPTGPPSQISKGKLTIKKG